MVVLFSGVGPVHATTIKLQGTVLSGLANPRGMTVGPDGWLYVAEAGAGGDGATITDGAGATVGYGRSGGVTRARAGVREAVLSNLASLAPAGGFGATGAHDVAFSDDGTLHVIFGFGANPALRANLAGEAGSDLLGKVASVTNGVATPVADLTEFESTDGPDAEQNSNPFSLVAVAGGFVATDAGGNDVLSIDRTGAVSLISYLPPQPNPLPFGPPAYQAVPTGAAAGPGGDILVGQLTGFPFPAGGANIFSIDAGGAVNLFAGGFTNLIDVAYGNGKVYALELDSDSLLGPNMTGALYELFADGTKTLLYGDLVNPTGLALGAQGRIYVAENGMSPTDGRVILLAPVPLPAALPLLVAGLGVLGGIGRRRTPRR